MTTTRAQHLQVLLLGKSDIGMVREENQDSFLTHSPSTPEEASKGHLLVLADGMGGLAWGGTASQIAVNTVLEVYYQGSADCVESMVQAAKEANRRIHQESMRLSVSKGSPVTMGSTLTALAILEGRRAIIAQVGDSRAYRISREGGIQQLTRDHTLVRELADRGEIEPNSLHYIMHRNVLTRGLGLQEEVEVDIIEIDNLNPEDTFLLCSDGLYDVIHDMEIQNWAFSHGEDVGGMIDEMIDQARSRGAPDNVTIVVARIGPDLHPREKSAGLARTRERALEWLQPSRGLLLYAAFFIVFALGVVLTALASGLFRGEDLGRTLEKVRIHPDAEEYLKTPDGEKLRLEIEKLEGWLKRPK